MKLPLSAYWRLLRRYLAPQRGAVLWMAVLLLTHTGAQIAKPQFMRAFVDAALEDSTRARTLTVIGLTMLSIQVVGAATDILARYWSRRVAWKATNDLRADVSAHLLRLDLDFFQTHPPGELLERVDGDVGALGGFFSTLTVELFGALLLLAGTLGALWLESVWLALALAACSVLAVGALAWVRRYGLPHLQAERTAQAGFWGWLGEVLSATEDVDASDAAGYVRRRTLGRLRAWLPVTVRAQVWERSQWWVGTAVGVVAFALARGLGARYVLGGRMTVGTLFMLFAYLSNLLWGPLEEIGAQLRTLQGAEVSITRVRELLQASSRLGEGTALLPAGAPTVEFRNVRFAYPSSADNVGTPPVGAQQEGDTKGRALCPSLRQFALDDVSFYLRAGRTLGVLGRTGSGKTTLGRLLYRFYDPQGGQVLLGGVDLCRTNLARMRARVGLVTQDVQLLSGTLRDNLCFYQAHANVPGESVPGVPDARLLQALRTLGLERWLARFPQGLDTPLSEATLSAGEAQLVALARVTLKDPDLIVLDEASSRLDPATEALLSRALDRLLAGRTALIIAHRLSTLARADEVLILEEGRVVEYGVRAELAGNPNSRLSQLLRTGMEEVQP
jgi:ABC-type multidrug transport system fused ATPase/permease subunit